MPVWWLGQGQVTRKRKLTAETQRTQREEVISNQLSVIRQKTREEKENMEYWKPGQKRRISNID